MKKISEIKLMYLSPIVVLIGVLIIFLAAVSKSEDENIAGECISTFVDGGGPYYKENAPFREKIAPDDGHGEKLKMQGKVLQNDCMTPVTGAVLDIWQASEDGSYQEEYYRGKVRVNKKGEYTFETVVPKGYGEGTAFRPPHIHFKVFLENREIITSQMFFPEVQGRPGFDDAYIMKLTTKERFGEKIHMGTHDIILP